MNKIITHPHPTLRKKSCKVKDFGNGLQSVIKTMKQSVSHGEGLGLAANQINVPKKIIIITDSPRNPENGQYISYINPKIINHSRETQTAKEGCLSVPDKEVEIERFNEITVLAQNPRGRRLRIRAKNLLARIFQHEIDHLNGRLIIDYEDDKKSKEYRD